MTGSCRRLLAALLIFVLSGSLLGQDAPTDRSHGLAPALAPVIIPNSPLGYFPPITPPGTTLSPVLPPRYPVGRYTGAPGTIVFQQMARAAGIIFSGRVTFIGHVPSSPGKDPAATTITFQVEHAMRGASPGQNLTIHEWAGLWPGSERYRVGERV